MVTSFSKTLFAKSAKNITHIHTLISRKLGKVPKDTKRNNKSNNRKKKQILNTA